MKTTQVPSQNDHIALIQMRNIVKIFKTIAGELTILKDINAEFQKGEFVSIVGKSGSGKSTLLNMITGIDHPTSGEVHINGTNIHQMTESQMSLWRGQNLGIVFQFFQLLPMLSLLENTMLPMDYCRVYKRRERPARAMELLKMVGLADEAHKLPAAISGGQQQSAAIARAMATDPPIIVADEPTGNLDSRMAEGIIDILDELSRQGKTILIVTHDPTLTGRTSRKLIISDGELVHETVVRALPLLTHQQMLEVTHMLHPLKYQPGATIIQQGERNDYFYMIVRGEVEVVLQSRRRSEISVARLGPGQFFGEVELIQGGKSVANVRSCSDTTVELMALEREKFIELLAESPHTQEAIARLVQQRLAENRAAGRRKGRVR